MFYVLPNYDPFCIDGNRYHCLTFIRDCHDHLGYDIDILLELISWCLRSIFTLEFLRSVHNTLFVSYLGEGENVYVSHFFVVIACCHGK